MSDKNQTEQNKEDIKDLQTHQKIQNGERENIVETMEEMKKAMEKGFNEAKKERQQTNNRIDDMFKWFLGLLVTLATGLGGALIMLWQFLQMLIQKG